MKKNSVLLSPRQRFSYKEGSDLPLVDLNEIMAFTGHTPKEAKQHAHNCRTDLAKEWKKQNPQTPEDCTKFYVETEGYLYDLFTWAHDPQMWEIFDKKIKGNERVLDYGAGIGDISIYLAEKGCDVISVELPKSHTKRFLMDRVYNRELGNKIKFKFDEENDSFDVVLGIDVLEHLHFPLRYVVQLTKLLKSKDSWCFFTPSFRDDHGVHPMHLEENYWLDKEFGRAMVALAFNPEFPVDEYYPIWYPLFKTAPQGAKRL